MSEHTPGKLVLSEDGLPELNNQNQIIESEKCDLIVYFQFTNKADARRLVACWNACDGIETDLLENIVMTGGTLKSRFALRTQEERESKAERDSLRAVNAELLAELQRIAEANPRKWNPEVRDDFMPWAQNRARAAIASARKQGEQG